MTQPAADAEMDRLWTALLDRAAGGHAALPEHPLRALFAPLFAAPRQAGGAVVVGRLAQSLDGRIAACNGASQWIGGAGDLRHTHRLRALCHAVVVGAGTIAADDPQLTTRLVPGPHPLRVVLDPRRRLASHYRIFTEGPPTLLVTTTEGPDRHGQAEVLRLPADTDARCDVAGLIAALAARGLTRIFVEGGGVTVSRFLRAGCLDRLHITIAPLILGSGRPAFVLPEVTCIQDGLRAPWMVHPLGDDILVDMAIDGARPWSNAT
ncbi:riboflavin-specific deaminase-like protein [Humitalea rosea]|uniref:Riboflavin-specific deaminase-like protein n=1 Tax=Humitalea rosea TaxID=990373 RepID=A0A2W7J486_9PROT|nr:RibD family protein [Humitalea rosea]PZW45883.1 riboflavin-specific deaminase-like protein [Humitalea rosea]